MQATNIARRTDAAIVLKERMKAIVTATSARVARRKIANVDDAIGMAMMAALQATEN